METIKKHLKWFVGVGSSVIAALLGYAAAVNEILEKIGAAVN